MTTPRDEVKIAAVDAALSLRRSFLRPRTRSQFSDWIIVIGCTYAPSSESRLRCIDPWRRCTTRHLYLSSKLEEKEKLCIGNYVGFIESLGKLRTELGSQVFEMRPKTSGAEFDGVPAR